MWTMRKGLSWAILLVLLDIGLARDAKFFSLFNVIKFKNEGCTGSSGDHGTCTTEDKCRASGGNPIGNCAAGFGICCRSTISNCGSTVQNNCTYIQNPGYPSFQTSMQTCTYSFGRIANDLCQIRLDFISTQMGVDDTGLCTDSVTVTSPTGINPPVVCGDLSGQHMYLETGNAGNAGSIAFAYAAAGTQRHRIKVTYLECNNLAKAPEYCTQYFTGISGSFQSYAYASEVLLHNQRYRTCFRREQGYCNTDFSTTTMDSFKLLNGGIAEQAKTSECTIAFVSLGLAAPPVAMICGERFDTEDGSILNGLVRARVEPFFLDTFSDTPTADEMGYDLTFRQSPCS